ncbi:MAG: hypothetical protein KDK07_05435 [Bauldia sp.]|nr:hypothetical protein [Bauldia sp.]
MGRRPHIPEPAGRRQVEAMAAYGVPEADIARVLGIDPKTLRKHYRDELDTGGIKANSKIAESLFRKAMGDGPQSVTACIFWLKTRAHWKETTVQEHVGNAGPIMKIQRVIISPPPRDSNGNLLSPPAAKGPPLLEHVGT